MPLPKAQRDNERSVFDEPSFGFGEETRALPSPRNYLAGTVAVAYERADVASNDPLIRIERKVERAIAALADLQRRIESIEETLATLMNR